MNEAWIAFHLNEVPIQTDRDGSFNCVCVMDAASCFILATAMVAADESEPSELEACRLFKVARSRKPSKPTKLFVPTGQFKKHVAAEASRQGIEVILVNEKDLGAFIGEARQGFKEHMQGAAGE